MNAFTEETYPSLAFCVHANGFLSLGQQLSTNYKVYKSTKDNSLKGSLLQRILLKKLILLLQNMDLISRNWVGKLVHGINQFCMGNENVYITFDRITC